MNFSSLLLFMASLPAAMTMCLRCCRHHKFVNEFLFTVLLLCLAASCEEARVTMHACLPSQRYCASVVFSAEFEARVAVRYSQAAVLGCGCLGMRHACNRAPYCPWSTAPFAPFWTVVACRLHCTSHASAHLTALVHRVPGVVLLARVPESSLGRRPQERVQDDA
jgi:hypothetical protein